MLVIAITSLLWRGSFSLISFTALAIMFDRNPKEEEENSVAAAENAKDRNEESKKRDHHEDPKGPAGAPVMETSENLTKTATDVRINCSTSTGSDGHVKEEEGSSAPLTQTPAEVGKNHFEEPQGSGAVAMESNDNPAQNLSEVRMNMNSSTATVLAANVTRTEEPSVGSTAMNMINSGKNGNTVNSPKLNASPVVGYKRVRGTNFTEEETFDLLNIWATPEIQFGLVDRFNHPEVWNKVADCMGEMGHDRTAYQCKTRLQNLLCLFYRIKRSEPGYENHNFPYYDAMEEVMTRRNYPTPEAIDLSGSSGSPINRASKPDFGGSFDAHVTPNEGNEFLVNANLRVNIASGSRSNNASPFNFRLSRRVSKSAGNSPLRVEANAWASQRLELVSNQSGSPSLKPKDVGPTFSGNRKSQIAPASATASPSEKLKLGYNATFPVEDGLLAVSKVSGHGGSCNGAVDRATSEMSVVQGAKRSFSFAPSIPAKRPRVASTSSNTTTTSSSTSYYIDDQKFHYLMSEVIDINRQWLALERQRMHDEWTMMMAMTQMLGHIVCPNKFPILKGNRKEMSRVNNRDNKM